MNYKNNIAALLLCATSHYAVADVNNGSFETWLAGSPSGWTTIDSGISVNKNTTIFQEGLSSAEITVNTGTQGSTDIQQLVSVVAGQTYEFSVWVYHTEGSIKARLYIDGYQGYSNESLVNQWQQVTHSYTASSTSDIAVGLRFYDIAGFDGSEIVYVDYFQPTQASGGVTGSCSTNNVTFSLTTDNYGYETSWTLTNTSNQEVASGNNYESSTSYNESYCLADDDYTFTINDTYGDGICCTYGNGSYEFSLGGTALINGGDFNSSETKTFTLGNTGGIPGGGGSGSGTYSGTYYDGISSTSGYPLKTELYNLIKDHANQGYSALWTFYENHSLDVYFENDGSILDIYSENPLTSDNYNFIKVTNQCGNYSGEGGCYNREHTFPKSWFGGKVEPMNSDVHHIYATDGFVNSKRGGFPYGEVATASFTSTNNSKLGSATTTLGYSGTVFEPIDEFKGDLARAQFYMATRYENLIGSWQNNSVYGDAILDGSSNQVFELWQLEMLLRWHTNDPVSQKEIDRNEAALGHQGNRNPFVDHPEYVDSIWGN
ncbi:MULTISPECIES: endonuclease [unclassified Colwellia]|jgi:endonuclease I|uniref:endonuclease n=1 Tax=unclassified Colwellia TaxID=196834 RepID=UPI0015F3C342|nr:MULTISPECIES: endonuclease [unclassified Colwellia]MBA6251867.1 endonuclease [Colwellia sp. MB3u-55]MBA6398388.1 endonuclease [Colwellia sp. BRX10-4]